MDMIPTLLEKRLLRVDEAAKILNVSRWTVYRWVEEGRIGGTRLGAGSLRIFSNTVAKLIDQHCVGTLAEVVAHQESQTLPKTSGSIDRQDSGLGGVRRRQQVTLSR